VVIGYYVDWGLYMVDVAGPDPRAVEQWRLSLREEGEGYKEILTPEAAVCEPP
jgi:hypothetical protein